MEKIFLGESLEDYLEAILILEKSGKIRSVDVARRLNVTKPSVNKAMNILKDKGFVLQESYGDIKLTEGGRQIAEKVYSRHLILTKFLHEVLGVNQENAESDACHMEHALSEESYQKLIEFTRQYLKEDL